MSSSSPDIEWLPFFLAHGLAERNRPMEATAHSATGGEASRVVRWQVTGGMAPARSYWAGVPVAPRSMASLTKLHQHAVSRFPSAPADCIHLGVSTPDGQSILHPACLANGQDSPGLSALVPGEGWRVSGDGALYFAEQYPIRDGDWVIAHVKRWTAVDPWALARERDELLDLIELHQQALWRMGHNIRTPLNAIFGMVQMVLMDIEPTGEAKVEWHHNVQMALNQFEATVKDAVSMPSLSGMSEPHVPADVAEALTVARRMLQTTSDAKSLRWHVQVGDNKVAIPAHALVEVLLNVLGNAIKHAPNASWVTVSTRLELPMLVVEVTNDIDPSKSVAWTDAEQTLRSVSVDASGDGVGLATSRFLLRRFAGRLALTAAQPNQCKATLHLPAA